MLNGIKVKKSNFSPPFILLFVCHVFLLFPVFLYAVENPYHHNNIAISYSQKEGFTLVDSPYESLRLGGYVEIDGRLFLGENQPKSTFLIRRARLFMSGTLYKTVGFLVMPRWDREHEIDLMYAWLETLRPNWVRFRIGLFKKPFGLEALKFDFFRNFAENSLVIRNFDRVIDLGVMVYGDVDSDRIAYSLGFFNGRERRLDNNNNKEIVGRFVYNVVNSHRFGQLYLGISGSTERQDEDLSGREFVTGTFTPFWKWTDNANKPVEVHASRRQWGMDMEWLLGPYYMSVEYLDTNWGKIHKGLRSKVFRGHGGYVECSCLFTGEDKPRNAPLYPKHNFDPCKDQWGAWELAARYEVFHASKKMIKLGFAKGANSLHGPTLALNWYLNPRMMMRLDGQYLWFNRPFRLHRHPFRYEVNIIYRAQAIF
jgi:phosphate-selective porin OprO/OprP